MKKLEENAKVTVDEDDEEDTEEILCQLEDNEMYLLYIIIAILITIVYVNYQKKVVICSAEDLEYDHINFKPIRIFGSLLTIAALIFFFNQSRCLESDEEDDEDTGCLAGLPSLLTIGASTLNLCNIADGDEAEVL